MPAFNIPTLLQGITLAGSSMRLLLLAGLPVIGLSGLAWMLFKKHSLFSDASRETHWLILLGGLALFLASLHNFNSFVHSIHSWIALFLGLTIVQRYLTSKLVNEHRVITIVSLMFCLMLAVPYSILSLTTWQAPRAISYGTHEKELISQISMPAPAQDINMITKHIYKHSMPEETIFVFNRSAMFYLLSDRRNATPFQFLIRHCNTDKNIQDALNSLIQKQPKFIVYDQHDIGFFQSDYRVTQQKIRDYRLTALENWIEENYLTIGNTGPYTLFESKF